MTKFTKVLAGALLAVFAFAGSANAYTHTTTLKLGSKGTQVMELQKTLNANGFTVSTSGVGSPGMESMSFASKTKAAVQKFQAAKGLTADGVVGPKSGAILATLGGVVGNLPAGCTSTAGYSPINGAPCNGNGTGPVQTGSVTVALSQDNPAAGNIVNNQAGADLMHVTFTGTGTVTSVMLKRSGLSSQNTLTNVYLYDGATRLSDGYSFNSMGELTINGLNLAVNGSRTIAVKADASNTAANDSSLAIALTSFTANGVTNVVNIMGNTFALATASNLATVTFNGSNSVSAANVNSGISGYALFRQSIQVNQRTVWLKGANFRVTGSAPASSLTNVKLFVDGIDTMKTATMTNMNGSNYISFDLLSSPFALTTGSHTVEVRGDVNGGASYTLQVGLQQASDLIIQDPQYGVNIAVSSFTASNGGVITINPGSATITQDPTFSAMTNITGGASNIAIAKFKVRGYGEDVRVNNLTVLPAISGTTPSAAGLDDVTVYFNGSQVGTQQDWTSGNLVFTLGSQMIVPANVDSTIEVRANIRTTAGANYTAGTVSATLVGNSSSDNAEGRTSYTILDFPSANVVGNSLTIQTGLLAVSANAGYTSQNVSPNMAGVKIGSFVLQNQSSSEGVRVTNLKVDLGFTGSQTVTNFSGLRTSENANYSVQPQASNNFSVDFTLAAGATRVVDIYADTSSVTTGTVVATLTASSIGVSSNVSSAGSAVTGQTITVASGSVATPTLLSSSSTQAQYIATGTTTGATNASKATFNFIGSNGASTISELKVTVTSGTASQTPVSSVTVNGVTAPVVATSSTVGVAYLTGLNIAVPNGAGGANVDAFLNYSPVGNTGAISGTTATASLTFVKSTSGGTTTTTTPAVSAPTMTVVASKPVVSIPSTQQTGLILGAENKIGEVTVGADTGGNIGLNTIVFNVGGSGLSAAVDINDTTPVLRSNGVLVTGVTCAAGAAIGPITCTFSGTNGYTIQSGSPITFSLFATVNNSATAGATASISTSITAAGFTWTDIAGNGTAAAGTGALIYNFPTNSYSIRQ